MISRVLFNNKIFGNTKSIKTAHNETSIGFTRQIPLTRFLRYI